MLVLLEEVIVLLFRLMAISTLHKDHQEVSDLRKNDHHKWCKARSNDKPENVNFSSTHGKLNETLINWLKSSMTCRK